MAGPWGQRFPPADGAGFQVILQGSCWLLPHGGGSPIALGVGDVLFLPRGTGHALADHPSTPLAEPSCEPHDPALSRPLPNGHPSTVTLCGAYQLDPTRAHPLLSDLPDTLHLPARLGHLPEIRSAVELLGGELENPRLGADTVVPALLDVLLLFILRAWFDQQPEPGPPFGWRAALADPAVSTALHRIHRSPAHRWTVESLATEAGLSRAAFAKRFTTLIGQPPLGYLTWWRLTTAARLLRESDAPLSTVAAQVGYGSEFAFANAFKREYRLAPGRYRREERPGPSAA